MSQPSLRIEHDLLGELAVPADAYYGVQTARALENFHISGRRAAALSGPDQGVRDGEDGGGARELRLRPVRRRRSSTGIEAACQELIDGKLHDQFRLDVFQGGAGTSTNMNANEVIANRALELMGHAKGEYAALRPARSRERLAVHQRRVPDRAARRHGARQRAADRGDAASWSRAFRAKGHEFARHREDGPHAAPGRRADDARPGVRRRSARRWPARSARSRRSSACSARSTWAAPPSARA